MTELDLKKTIGELEEKANILSNEEQKNDVERFEEKTLEQINRGKDDVESALLIGLTENEINHIQELNKILDEIKLKKGTLIECFILILEYKDKHESFNYEEKGNLASKLALSNFNNILKGINIDGNSVNFDMVREYVKKNPKK